tara:strand:+ start:28 stop:258 length:231 start_codon:yes stop_codon:yes gene_type:complete
MGHLGQQAILSENSRRLGSCGVLQMTDDLEGIYKLHWRHKPIPEGWQFAADLDQSHHSARAILIKKIEPTEEEESE